jgi:hypothetical protein
MTENTAKEARLVRLKSYLRNETDMHTTTAGALPSPAVQCIYVTPPFRFMALYNLLTAAGSCNRKSNASKSLPHQTLSYCTK